MAVSSDSAKWDGERKKSLDYLQFRISQLIDEGYKKEVLMIQGDMTTYHGKIMRVVDRGKALGIPGFSLVPPPE